MFFVFLVDLSKATLRCYTSICDGIIYHMIIRVHTSMCAKLCWSLYICVHFSVVFICFVQAWLIYKSWVFKEITFEPCKSPELSKFPAFEETQKAHLDILNDTYHACVNVVVNDRSYLCQGHLTQRDLSGRISMSPRWSGPPAWGHLLLVAGFKQVTFQPNNPVAWIGWHLELLH